MVSSEATSRTDQAVSFLNLRRGSHPARTIAGVHVKMGGCFDGTADRRVG